MSYISRIASTPLTTYIDKVARFSEQNHHGGLLSLATAQPLDSVPTDLVFTTGIGKFIVVVNAGSDYAGTITVTGTSVDRNTGSETGSDTETLTIDALTTDNSTTDAQSNVVHGFTGAYITSKWWRGSVTLSTTNLTLTDVDIYHVSFEQFNDQSDVELTTLDFNGYETNAAAWVYAYLYVVVPYSTNKVAIASAASISIVSGTATANRYYRLRRGNIGQALNGATDGVFLDVFFGPTNQTYWEDATIKVWADIKTRDG